MNMRSLCSRVEEAVRRGHAELGPDEWLEYHRTRGFLTLVKSLGARHTELDVSYLVEKCLESG